ncbi:XdhC family protein [Glaciecola sp. KUL10]|uniref:XdhC family protein n=1 Tax=Glaciecola sp. (strain KUL10) TaxID=2161813 RepID=UPI000D9185F2|nr:XdhC/CoxI family protein [Glaciecola sp. KUL10]GBL03480.1 xanthine and CO dehydrogenases maturation factor, XdhC/CoxF family [Glaciecola sp. KUL10]
MSQAHNTLHGMLEQWYPQKDSHDWVLGTIYKTQGSSYRKAGAMMMLSSSTQQLGLLSGGCLESDIVRKARQVMETGKSMLVCYDATDEDDLSYQLGIGCGGVVHIMLQAVNSNNSYLNLDKIRTALVNKQSIIYRQFISCEKLESSIELSSSSPPNSFSDTKTSLISIDEESVLESHIFPRAHLLICGGGVDARPLAEFASKVGWEVSIWDPRPANARLEHFQHATRCLSDKALDFKYFVEKEQVHAAVLMTHTLALDAHALKQLIHTNLGYIGLLGPVHRKEQVFEQAQLSFDKHHKRINGPIGFDIGARLPESIALATLAEIHQTLYHHESKAILAPFQALQV